MDIPPSTADVAARDPLTWVRSLARRYLLVLAVVAVLVVVDQAIIQSELVRLNFYAPAINVAGRQRMLSQKVTKEALALASQPAGANYEVRHGALHTALTEWSAAHQSLLNGDTVLGLEPISNPSTRAALASVEPPMRAIRQAAIEIASAAPATGTRPRRSNVSNRSSRPSPTDSEWEWRFPVLFSTDTKADCGAKTSSKGAQLSASVFRS